MRSTPEPYVLEPLPAFREYPQPEMIERARAFHADLQRRRTVRDFDTRPVPPEVIEHCLLAAGTAPSGANQQPWFFSVITDLEHQRRVREAAEVEERTFYNERAPQEWLDALAPLTHTPNPMSFLNKLCRRPTSEKPVILLVVGYAKPGRQVLVHGGIKKPLAAIAEWL
jgi:hypothetical protein